jgi:hypothetical protein
MHPHARRTPHAMYGSTALCPGGIFKLDLILGGDHTYSRRAVQLCNSALACAQEKKAADSRRALL